MRGPLGLAVTVSHLQNDLERPLSAIVGTSRPILPVWLVRLRPCLSVQDAG